MSRSWLWTELHDLFEVDDGSLPEIHVDLPGGKAMSAAYALLRARGGVQREPALWSPSGDELVACTVTDPAAAVVSGQAAPFHVLFPGIRVEAVTLPALGVFIFPDQLALDYRMGPEWGPAELEALFMLLSELADLRPCTEPAFDDGGLPTVKERFERAWRRWRAEQGGET